MSADELKSGPFIEIMAANNHENVIGEYKS